MSPPTDAGIHSHHSEMNDDIQKLKWAGWIVFGTIAISWAGWLSMLAISNSNQVSVITDRQQTQYERLREDIGEIKSILRN